jgi:hypothetical protein
MGNRFQSVELPGEFRMLDRQSSKFLAAFDQVRF